MSGYNFNIYGDSIFGNPCFAEATAEELRVFVALTEMKGKATKDELMELCLISEARLHSAILFWVSAGVISAKDKADIGDYGNEITDEFANQHKDVQPSEINTAYAAKIIRENGLTNLLNELSALAKKEISPYQIKSIAAYVSDYRLTDEYIMNLAAHLDAAGVFTLHTLLLKLKFFTERGIITADELNSYIQDRERHSKDIAEYRRIFGIYNRNLSASEIGYIEKWSGEYCFGTQIVELAFDKTVVAIGKLSFTYMDAILKDWHESGSKTIEDCEKRYELKKSEFAAQLAKKDEPKPRAKRAAKESEPRFGNFDPEEAFRLALERTYANTSSNGDGE